MRPRRDHRRAAPRLPAARAGRLAAGIGIDLVDVERFALVLARRRGIAERLFTALELSQAAGATPAARAGRLAARFAAKEAVLKSLGVGLGAARFRDIEVRRLDSGRPELRLAGAAAQLAAERGVTRWHVSLSHTGLTAAAVVHAETSDARPES